MNLKQTLSAVMVGAMVLTAAPSLSVLPQAARERIVRSIIITANNFFIIFPFHFSCL